MKKSFFVSFLLPKNSRFNLNSDARTVVVKRFDEEPKADEFVFFNMSRNATIKKISRKYATALLKDGAILR